MMILISFFVLLVTTTQVGANMMDVLTPYMKAPTNCKNGCADWSTYETSIWKNGGNAFVRSTSSTINSIDYHYNNRHPERRQEFMCSTWTCCKRLHARIVVPLQGRKRNETKNYERSSSERFDIPTLEYLPKPRQIFGICFDRCASG